jgi:hypothetical protein
LFVSHLQLQAGDCDYDIYFFRSQLQPDRYQFRQRDRIPDLNSMHHNPPLLQHQVHFSQDSNLRQISYIIQERLKLSGSWWKLENASMNART